MARRPKLTNMELISQALALGLPCPATPRIPLAQRDLIEGVNVPVDLGSVDDEDYPDDEFWPMMCRRNRESHQRTKESSRGPGGDSSRRISANRHVQS